jgi:hypothetical protein
VTDEVTARLVGRYREGSTGREREALVASLTRGQARVLQASGLRYSQLAPQQQSLMRTILADQFLQDPTMYASSILNGVGVELFWGEIRAAPGAVEIQAMPQFIDIWAPVVGDDGELRGAGISQIWLPGGASPDSRPLRSDPAVTWGSPVVAAP